MMCKMCMLYICAVHRDILFLVFDERMRKAGAMKELCGEVSAAPLNTLARQVVAAETTFRVLSHS